MFWSFILVAVLIGLMDLTCERLGVPRVRSYFLILLVVAVVQPVTFVLFTGVPPDPFQLILVTGVGLMIWFMYLNIAQAVNSSLRIRVLLELSEKGAATSFRELSQKYNDEDLIRMRLARLVSGGAVEKRSEKYYLNSGKLVHIANFFSLLKSIVVGKASQFD